LTAVVEVDVAVDVEPIVDLDVDLRGQILPVGRPRRTRVKLHGQRWSRRRTSPSTSTFGVKVDVNVNVIPARVPDRCLPSPSDTS
jgi:hypothetical protein